MVNPRGIAIIGGTGNQGFGLALRWAKAGEQVWIGSRQAGKAADAAERVKNRVGPEVKVEGVENREAVSRTNLIVLTVPFAAHRETLKALKGSFKSEDTLVDVTVPLEVAVGGTVTRVVGVWAGSAAEQTAEIVGSPVRVVAAFHNVGSSLLTDLAQPVDCDVIVCGNDRPSKSLVKSLVGLLPGAGFVDGGPLGNSRTVEALTALLLSINQRYKSHSVGIRITGLSPPKR